jgi:hypothetical protein
MTDADAAGADRTILQHISQLVAEERRLRAGGHGLSAAERQRLQLVEQHLDQAWDLLRQRRAREESGEDPDSAAERSVNEVESYLQ